MATSKTIYIERSRFDWCEGMVREGVWDNRSEIINYAMRFYLDHITRDGIRYIEHLPVRDRQRVCTRLDDYVLNKLYETGFFELRVIPDYSLAFYIRWLEKDGPKGP